MVFKKETLALDMDEVVADLIGSWFTWCKKQAGLSVSYEPKEFHWDVAKSFPMLPRSVVYSFLELEGTFLNLPPILDASAGVHRLKDIYDIYFLTAAKSKTAFSEKILWISSLFGDSFGDKVIACSSGDLKNKLSGSFDIMVDDNPRFINKAYGECFTILFTAEHNVKAELGSIDLRVNNWEELTKCLTERHRDREL